MSVSVDFQISVFQNKTCNADVTTHSHTADLHISTIDPVHSRPAPTHALSASKQNNQSWRNTVRAHMTQEPPPRIRVYSM